MKIDELVAALQPLVGWHIYAASQKLNDTMPCHAVRRLERYERQDKENVILASSSEEYFNPPPGITLLAKNVVRVDWTGDRAWIETKHNQLGYFQRVGPIETTEPSKGAQDAV